MLDFTANPEDCTINKTVNNIIQLSLYTINGNLKWIWESIRFYYRKILCRKHRY